MWVPPWPPIQIAGDEWVVVRETPRHPAAVVRRFDSADGPYFRVVTWSLRSTDRQLIGRFASLAEADRAVKFPLPTAGPESAGYPSESLHAWKLTEDVLRFEERSFTDQRQRGQPPGSQ